MTEKIFGKLVQEIEENYMTIDNAILKDLKRQNKEYKQVCRRLIEMENQYPFLTKLSIGQGEMILSDEEHKIFSERQYGKKVHLFSRTYRWICLSKGKWSN